MEERALLGNYQGVSAGFIITERCHYCSKQKSPKDIITMSGGAKICTRCWHWHHHALDVLAGDPPRGCQECHVDYDVLERRSIDGNVRMSVIALDGIYAVVCPSCGDKIVRKRVDLFGDTEYGHKLKLKGSK